MLYGIDFSYGSGLTTDQIKAAHKSFVCRYLSGGNPKDISSLEVKNYKAAGIPVVFVWETTGTDMVSFNAGVNDAHGAQAELDSLANAVADQSLRGAPVFFAADEAQEPDLRDYLRGVNSVIGKGRTGIYGGIGSCTAAFDAGLVSFGWQTIAWSNGEWEPRALLRQLDSGKVGPASVDFDEAAYWTSSKILTLADDFGQWPRPQVHTPPPAKGPFEHTVGAGNTESLDKVAQDRGVTRDDLVKLSLANLDKNGQAMMNAYVAYDDSCAPAGADHATMGTGFRYYTLNP